VKARFDEARKLVAAIRVRVSEPGAEVRIDGATSGASPLPAEVFVDPGARVVTAELAGFEAAPVTVQAEKGGSYDVTIELVRAAKRAPDAEEKRNPDAVRPVPPSSGDRGEPPLLAHAMNSGANAPSGSRALWTGLVVGGSVVTAAGVGTAIGFFVTLNDTSEHVEKEDRALERDRGPDACGSEIDDSLKGRCDAQREAVDSLPALRTGAAIGISVAAAAGAATVLYGVFGRASIGETTVLPAVTRNAGALLVTGVW
jgi:hypothetical protein